METTPLVSVILPTYNREGYLRRSIDSVIKQTYLNWELIIWDDGSTDDTEEVVKSYNNPKIKYYFEENRGAYYARNKSIIISKGEYLAFLDSDDEWTDEKLVTQVDVLITHPAIDFIFSDFYNINLISNEKSAAFEKCLSAMKLLEVEQVSDNLFIIRGGFLEGLSVDNFIATDTVVMRRGVLERTGYFHEGIRSSEDFELWWRMGLAGVSFAYINKVYLTRYKYPGSLSSPSVSSFENRIKVLDLCSQETFSSGRKNLVPYLNRLYRNAWQNMISFYGSLSDTDRMALAFMQSLKYGFSLGSVRLLFQSIWDSKRNIREDK
jgi:glycosyltransferase involved in cell wall biosynthesis